MAKKGKPLASLTVNRIWLGFFIFWFLLLTGLFETWMKTPGLKQWVELHNLLSEKKQEIATIEAESARLKDTEHQLESNPVAQEREIRKVLGFVDQNEMVFEFEK